MEINDLREFVRPGGRRMLEGEMPLRTAGEDARATAKLPAATSPISISKNERLSAT